MQILVWIFQHVCKKVIKLFYKMQKPFWFFQQVGKNFQHFFVLDASFFVIFLKTNAKI